MTHRREVARVAVLGDSMRGEALSIPFRRERELGAGPPLLGRPRTRWSAPELLLPHFHTQVGHSAVGRLIVGQSETEQTKVL